MKFGHVSSGLFVCLALIAQAMPAFAQQQPPMPPPPAAFQSAPPSPNAGFDMPPPAFSSPPGWPSEFRRPRSPEDMRRWQQDNAGMPPPDWRPHHHLSPDEQEALRRDLNRARREIYQDWRAWPLPPPTLPPPRPDHQRHRSPD